MARDAAPLTRPTTPPRRCHGSCGRLKGAPLRVASFGSPPAALMGAVGPYA
jgi:hypothetical protein